MKNLLVISALIAVTGCVYTPKTVSVYDEECDIVVKEMRLESHQIESLTACESDNCYASVLGAGFLSAGSAIVSGSIVITANIAYWFEKQAQCEPVV